VARISISEAGGASVCAFLDMLAHSEIGAPLLAASDDGYNVIVGSTASRPILFSSYTDHPRQLIVLNAGLKSSAAGRPQFLARTWDDLRARLKLRDFSPINQDRACIELLRQCGALPHVLAGGLRAASEITAAITKAAPIWASLPGAGYGQHENKLMDLLGGYGAALAHYQTPAQAMGVA
jgi:muramidase (phage lysozyme)